LALSAPAAYWLTFGGPELTGWWLWVLTWLQSAASIVYAYLRLEQRVWPEAPSLIKQVNDGKRAIMYSSFNFLLTGFFSSQGLLPNWTLLPYALQWGETIWGTFFPALSVKPTQFGLRQLFVRIQFTILFITTWNVT
jgi:hypothetical protein